MVTPVNFDKPITTDADRTTQPNPRANSESVADQSPKSATQTADAESRLDVENARQLYQLETNKLETVRPEIETPEQAKTLLNRILQQFSATPEDALEIQGGGSNGLLTNLLSAAPSTPSI